LEPFLGNIVEAENNNIVVFHIGQLANNGKPITLSKSPPYKMTN
jgi:hypothetical protein